MEIPHKSGPKLLYFPLGKPQDPSDHLTYVRSQDIPEHTFLAL